MPRVGPENVHGTCVDFSGTGVLLIGPPGSGKSDLALRLIDMPGTGTGDAPMRALLVADDRTDLAAHGGRVVASPPECLAGRLEVRGLGILRFPYVARTALGLVAELVASEALERLPELPWGVSVYCGLEVPCVRIVPFEASAPAKLRAAVRALTG